MEKRITIIESMFSIISINIKPCLVSYSLIHTNNSYMTIVLESKGVEKKMIGYEPSDTKLL